MGVSVGNRYGRLIVISETSRGNCNQRRWLCKCDCGKESVVIEEQLLSGRTKSCGCLRYERLRESNIKHGESGTELYHRWLNMRNRCNNPKCERYANYGGRGIKVCKEWDDFSNFKSWALSHGYHKELTIDRINVDGNYCPENCRWVDNTVQMNNTSRNHYLTYNGETHSLAEWARIVGIKYTVLRARINRSKWDVEKALFTPVERG